jgi:uncharacterized protein (TIGR00730 family)
MAQPPVTPPPVTLDDPSADIVAPFSAAAPRRLSAMCIFCGANAGTDPAFRAAAEGIGRALASHGATLVTGGGSTGLMGAANDGALAAGGKVFGVIPDFLKNKELADMRSTELVVVPDMHTRKRTMFERADAFCILPGGVGTLDETFEIVTWRQLHLHNKPIILLNVKNYWAHLLAMFDQMRDLGFAHHGHQALVTVVESPAEVILAAERELAEPKPLVRFPGMKGT